MDAGLETLTTHKYFQVSETDFVKLLGAFLEAKPQLELLKWEEPQFEKYQMAFDQIKSEMSLGRLKKAVPVMFAKADAHFDSLRRARALKNLVNCPAHLFIYGAWQEHDGFLGATPEILAVIEGEDLRSVALAGTQIKGTGECQLLSDSKELFEHELVTDDVVKVLSEFGDVRVDGPKVLELPNLWHLKTDIHLKLKNKLNPVELICKMHPTPALGVSPREFDFQWMRGLPESELRKKHGAPFAMWLPNGDFVSVVAIRNIQWNQTQVLLGAGGGIVQSSELQKEWLELEGKRNAVKALMGL